MCQRTDRKQRLTIVRIAFTFFVDVIMSIPAKTKYIPTCFTYIFIKILRFLEGGGFETKIPVVERTLARWCAVNELPFSARTRERNVNFARTPFLARADGS